MMNMYFTIILGFGLSLTLALIVVGVLCLNPRLMLHRFPPSIQKRTPKKTKSERKYDILLSIPYYSILLLLPFLSLFVLRYIGDGKMNYWDAAFHLLVIYAIYNLIDFLLVNRLFIGYLTPKILALSDLVGRKEYVGVAFHFRGFLANTGLSAAVSGSGALIVFIQ
ncbi:hypothetical protein [Cohnella boryungensis]|uniref:Nitroreductase n=1 Tax=Cohnella boryungensis TaxID=768479 RepID=A0ABV8SGC9_9BACL